MISIYVKKPTGDLLELEVDPTTVTLFDLKKKICDAENQDSSQQDHAWKPSMISLFLLSRSDATAETSSSATAAETSSSATAAAATAAAAKVTMEEEKPRWDPKYTPLHAGDMVGVVCHVQRTERVWMVTEASYNEGDPFPGINAAHAFRRRYDAIVYLIGRMEEHNRRHRRTPEWHYEFDPKEIFARATSHMEFTTMVDDIYAETIQLKRVPYTIVE